MERTPPTPENLLPQLPAATFSYVCPHENGPVSEAVHRARLAADDPACRGCPHGHTVDDDLLQYDDGNVRARYRNTVSRDTVREWVASAARHFVDANDSAERPRIVIGHDERSSSPDLAVALQTLTTHGCDTIDIGRTLRPMLDFAVRRASADAGLFVTGGNRPAGWTGLDLVDRGGRPSSWPGRCETVLGGSTERRTRSAGRVIARQIDRYYLEDLRDISHGLRPLTVIVLTQTRHATMMMTQLAAALPGRVLVEQVSRREAATPTETLRSLRYHGFPASDFACAISLDARTLECVDECGAVIRPPAIARGLSELGGGTPTVAATDLPTEEQVDTSADVSVWSVNRDSIAGPDENGFRRRDAFWLLTLILRRLAVSDAPASHVFTA